MVLFANCYLFYFFSGLAPTLHTHAHTHTHLQHLPHELGNLDARGGQAVGKDPEEACVDVQWKLIATSALYESYGIVRLSLRMTIRLSSSSTCWGSWSRSIGTAVLIPAKQHLPRQLNT
mmetsp:Transcript_23668/g.66221  ORF Transcript_23668/g.66221 Transcript_23668/m.66221 type:complete len:119 (-) Transcript_23668:918-1274(-)